jgi:hypothetical protein
VNAHTNVRRRRRFNVGRVLVLRLKVVHVSAVPELFSSLKLPNVSLRKSFVELKSGRVFNFGRVCVFNKPPCSCRVVAYAPAPAIATAVMGPISRAWPPVAALLVHGVPVYP